MDDSTANQIFAPGYSHVVLGYDSSPTSPTVRKPFIAAGCTWDAYRFLYPGQDAAPQVDDIVKGIHATALPLPGYLWLDIEEYHDQAPSTALIHAALDRVEQADIKPEGTLVKPGIYTSKGIWDTHYAGYTEPAERGWALWTASWGNGEDVNNTPLYGGWTRAEGLQTAGNTSLSGLQVDLNVFRDRAAPGPLTLEQRVAALEAWRRSLGG